MNSDKETIDETSSFIENEFSNKDNFKLFNCLPLLFFITVIMMYYCIGIALYFIPNTFPYYVIYTKEYFPIVIDKNANHSMVVFFIYSFCYLNLVISLILTYITNPGEIPNEPFWNIKTDKRKHSQEYIESIALIIAKREMILEENSNCITINNDTVYQINERNKYNEIRYCYICMMFKPDRTHHCQICNKCILKIDHHCSLIGCCIGYFNYKFYLNLLLYIILSSFLYIVIFYDMTKDITTTNIINSKMINIAEMSFLLLYMITIIIFVFSLVFYSYHIYLVCHNYTSYEYLRNDNKNYNQYDLGSFYSNMQEVFGSNFLLWFIPLPLTFRNDNWHNGINFKIKEEYH